MIYRERQTAIGDAMSELQFTLADAIADRSQLVQINIEYMEWVAAGLEASCGISLLAINGQSIVDYVESAIEKVCSERPPRGVFYLVRQEAAVVGMVGLRPLSQQVAEIKRLYVREAFRRQQFGVKFLDQVIADARAFGYQKIQLDTAPFMLSAQQLYQASGFVDRPPYPGTEVPAALHAEWRFMELNLSEK